MTTLRLVRASYGVFLLADPQRALRVGHSPNADSATQTVVRVLGVRHLLQAAVCARWPTRSVRRASACIDGLHAATDLALARSDRRQRRAAAIDGAVAVGLAVATLAATS
ncbi:MAG: hypothetical protein LC713_05500 [Actinobacteria bacterium]|nr:hypothetical protein [Actinomycetota bacterium]